jgi:hypothetical protein
MRAGPGTITKLLAACLLAPSLSMALGEGEVTVAGSSFSGDYGTGTDIDSQRFTVRYVTGGDWQFGAALSMVRITAAAGVTYTGLGSPSTSGKGGDGRGAMNGSGGETGAPAQGEATTLVTREGDWASGLGDLWLSLSRRIIGGGIRVYRFDANVEVKAPLADEEQNLGTGEWDYRLGWAGEYRFWSLVAYGGLGWNRLGDPAWVDFNNVFDGYLGVDSNPFAGERLIASGWVDGWQEVVDGVGHRAAVGVGIRSTGKTRWRLQVRAGLTDAAEDLNVILGLAFGVAPGGPGLTGHLR